MQLFVLDPTTYLPTRLVEGYSSLIWTERYVNPGDVQINVADSSILDMIRPETLLGIAGSTEVIRVETHEEKINDNGYPETVVKGRTVDYILDERIIWAPHGASLTLPRAYTYRDAALMYIWSSVVNTKPDDVANTVPRPSPLYQNSPIPGVLVTDSTKQEDGGVSVQFSVNVGEAGGTIRGFLSDSDLGLRTIRPASQDSSKYILVVTANGANKGFISKIDQSYFNELRFDVYKGVDRSKNQTDVPAVSFLGAAGHLADINVLDSDQDRVTDLIISTDTSTYGSSNTWLTGIPLGFGRRIRYLDGGEFVEGVASGDQATVIAAVGRKYYADHAGYAILSGSVSDVVPYRFNVDYAMGDIVTLVYNGLERDVRVTEYTRSEDRTGQREYPTFTAVPS